MNRKIMYGLGGGVILSLIGLIIGLLIGTTIGGNYFTSFEFMSSRGYEAVGYLGAIIGAIIGMASGFWLGIKGFNKKKNIK